MKNNRMFLIEKGTFVVVRDGKKEVSFTSFQEFNKFYPGLNLSGKDYVDYEPGRGLFIDNSDPDISIKDAPAQDYESVIDSIDSLIENKNDPFYGATLEDARQIKIKQIKSESTNAIYMKWPLFKQINLALGIYDDTEKQACISDIQKMIADIAVVENEIQNETDIDTVKAKVKANQ